MAENGIPMVQLSPNPNGNGEPVEAPPQTGGFALADLMTAAYWEAQVAHQEAFVAQIEGGVAQLRMALAQQETRLAQAKGRLEERRAYLDAVKQLAGGGN